MTFGVHLIDDMICWYNWHQKLKECLDSIVDEIHTYELRPTKRYFTVNDRFDRMYTDQMDKHDTPSTNDCYILVAEEVRCGIDTGPINILK